MSTSILNYSGEDRDIREK